MLPVTQLILLFSLFEILTQCYGGGSNKTKNCTSSTKLALTIEVYSQKLEVAWDSQTMKKGDWIAVYDSVNVPTWLSGQKGLYSFEVTNKTGRQMTPISPEKNLLLDITSRMALKYSACYWRKRGDGTQSMTDEAITTTKYYTFPDWIKNYWESIKSRSLSDIFIPGTVNSACYTIQTPEPVINQLASGIRYLDIRISFHNHEFYAAYYDCCQTKLHRVLADLRYFIRQSKQEVVILDITKIKNVSSSKFPDNKVTSLQTIFDKIANFFSFWKKNDGKKNTQMTFDDYLLSVLNLSLRVDGKPIWIENDGGGDAKSVYNKTLQDILQNGSRVIISYPNSAYDGTFKNMVWQSYLSTFNWTISDLREFFFREAAFPEFQLPNQTFYVDVDNEYLQMESELTKSANKTGNGSNAGLQVSSTESRNWGIDHSYNLAVNILFGQYFRNIGNIRTAFVWNERLTSETGLCDREPSSDKNTWYHQHNIIE